MISPVTNTSRRDSLFDQDKAEKEEFDIDTYNLLDFDIDEFKDFFSEPNAQQDATSTHVCECGQATSDQEDLDKHEAEYCGTVARAGNNNMEDTVDEQHNLALFEAPPVVEEGSRPTLISNSSKQTNMPSARVTPALPDPRAELSHDFMAEARQQTASNLTPHNSSHYVAVPNDASTPQRNHPHPHGVLYPQPQPTFTQPQQTNSHPGQAYPRFGQTYLQYQQADLHPERAYPPSQPKYNPTNDTYLAVFDQHSGYRPAKNLDRNPLPRRSSNLPASNPAYVATQSSPFFPSTFTRVNTNTNTNTTTRGRGRGRGRPRGRPRGRTPLKGEPLHHHNPSSDPISVPSSPVYNPSSPIYNAYSPKSPTASPTPGSDDAPATKKRKRTNNEKQAKSRQRKADKQEALESEVQRLRLILGALGGCAEGEPVTGTNWF